MVVWTAAAAAGAAAGVAATSLTLGGGSGGAVATGARDGVATTGPTMGGGLGGGSRHLILLMLSVADLFSSFPRLYKASIWVHLGHGVVTFSTTPLYHLVFQFLPKRHLHSALLWTCFARALTSPRTSFQLSRFGILKWNKNCLLLRVLCNTARTLFGHA